jgi:hypothetical protein
MKSKYKKIKLKDGTVKDEHRLLVEEYLGRELDTDEVVHHCDENKGHNVLENLDIDLRTEHSRKHMLGRPSPNKGVKANHGTRTRYEKWGCRCPACKECKSKRNALRKRKKVKRVL